jgi:integrase
MAQRDLFRSSPKPWNAARIIGPKPPFKPKHVWAIRQQLKASGCVRDLALFDCGIDAKLRGCDLVRLRLSDVAPGGSLRQRATVIQQKTVRPVPFEITDPTREALAEWIALRGSRSDDWLSPSRSRPGHHISTRQYARLVDRWVTMIGLDARAYGTHSLRRTKVALVYKKTGNLRACQLLLGHRKLESRCAT